MLRRKQTLFGKLFFKLLKCQIKRADPIGFHRFAINLISSVTLKNLHIAANHYIHAVFRSKLHFRSISVKHNGSNG